MKIRQKYFIFAIPFLLEFIVCNAGFWTSRISNWQSERSLVSSEFHAEGLQQEQSGGNTFSVTDSESGQHYLEFGPMDEDARSIYLDLALEGADYVSCDIYAKDEGNSAYYHIPSDGAKSIIVPSVSESKWFRTHFYGKLQGLRIQLDTSQAVVGSRVSISEISINKRKAMHFSLLRVLAMEIFIMLVAIFRKGSSYYDLSYDEQKACHKAGVGAVILINILFFVFLTKTVSPSIEKYLTEGGSHEQYQKLAVAMTEGHVYLDDKVPDWMIEMDNPYDQNERDRVIKEAGGEPYLWDNVYYDGHYYVYFGIVPVLLCYLPYYLIFHTGLPNYIPILISWIVTSIVLVRLIGTVIKKWFPKFPYIMYLLMAAVLPSSIGSIAILQRPTIYEVPISMGVMFAILGLDLWLEAVEGKEIVSIPKMAAGSLCMALVAGCRPNVFLIFLFSFFIFGKFIVRDKKLCIQKYWKEAAIFAAPFAVVAAGLMYYNWSRFGSVFDFGANYNLTNNDLTKRGIDISRIGVGLFEFLWKPFSMSVKFPFIKTQGVESAYMGKTIASWGIGGVLLLCPFLMFALLVFILGKRIKQYKQPFQFAIVSIVLTLVLVMVTTNTAGIYPRYKADFCFLIGLAGVIAVCMADKYFVAEKQEIDMLGSFRWIVFLTCMISMILNFLSFFASVEFALWKHNPNCFYTLKYIFEFWN